MTRYAFVFPGQGSQKIGMARDILDAFPETRAVFEVGNRVLNRDILSIILNGPAETLTLTANAQPAIFLVSAAILSVLRSTGISPSVVAGHSLGEITAYYAAGVIDLETALRIIDVRGRAMADSVPAGLSGMAAVIGMDLETITQCLVPFSESPVVAANLNCPGQIVISGEIVALQHAIDALKAAGAKVIALPVSGAFHSPMMTPAVAVLTAELESIVFNPASPPIVLNRTAQAETSPVVLKDNLPQQVISPVRWIESVGVLGCYADAVLEVGPGKVLQGLIKKIAPELPVQSIADAASIKGVLVS